MKSPDDEPLFTLSLQSLAARSRCSRATGCVCRHLTSKLVRLLLDLGRAAAPLGTVAQLPVTWTPDFLCARARTRCTRRSPCSRLAAADTLNSQTVPHAELITSKCSHNGKGTEVLEVGLAVVVNSTKVAATVRRGRSVTRTLRL